MNDRRRRKCIAEFSYSIYKIPDTQNATNINQTSRHVHNPVYDQVINNQPGPHNHQLGAERKQNIPTK